MSDNEGLRDNGYNKQFWSNQQDIRYKTFVLQKLNPGKSLIHDPWPHDELSDEEAGEIRAILNRLMPLDTIVTDMWDWDLHFEDSTFEDCYFDVALGSEDFAIAQADSLKDDICRWIDEYSMDYGEDEFTGNEFEEYILNNCRNFILRWRSNIIKSFVK